MDVFVNVSWINELTFPFFIPLCCINIYIHLEEKQETTTTVERQWPFLEEIRGINWRNIRRCVQVCIYCSDLHQRVGLLSLSLECCVWAEHLLRVFIFSQDGGGETKRETRSEKVRDLRENGLEVKAVSPLFCTSVRVWHTNTQEALRILCGSLDHAWHSAWHAFGIKHALSIWKHFAFTQPFSSVLYSRLNSIWFVRKISLLLQNYLLLDYCCCRNLQKFCKVTFLINLRSLLMAFLRLFWAPETKFTNNMQMICILGTRSSISYKICADWMFC